MKIAHCFVGDTVESEMLNSYGEVYAFGKGEKWHSRRNVKEYFICDLTLNFPIQMKFDFMFLQPPCGRFSCTSPNPNEHPNHIPRARELGEKYAEDYVIENVWPARTELKNPVRLEGSMFGLELRFRRGFESSFPIPQPTYNKRGNYQYNATEIRKAQAKHLKGYAGDYPVHSITRNSLPAHYVKYIMESYNDYRNL